MTGPEHGEVTAAELPQLMKGELEARLPLEGWRTVTLHCQIDGIGPSDRHPDLVKLDVSFPPVRAHAAVERVGINCPACGPTRPEQHPQVVGLLRCSNCKEHLGPGRLEDVSS